jgi:PhoH-like ATPase
MTKKIFFLDTNILLHDPQAFFNFPDSEIILHLITVTELESFKKEPAQRGYNAREAIRILDDFRSQGSLIDGVSLEKILSSKFLFRSIPVKYLKVMMMQL